MLIYVNSDLFETDAQALVNPVNTVGVMGKGLAAQFKRRYPAMFEAYRQHCRFGNFKIGQLFLYQARDNIIVNFPTKQHWRNSSRMEWIEQGLAAFTAQYKQHGITSVAFPQLGCGLGGLDWSSEVQPLMERYLHRLEATVYVVIR